MRFLSRGRSNGLNTMAVCVSGRAGRLGLESLKDRVCPGGFNFVEVVGSPIAIPGEPGSVVSAGCNGDGLLDLATAHRDGNNGSVPLGNGNGNGRSGR